MKQNDVFVLLGSIIGFSAALIALSRPGVVTASNTDLSNQSPPQAPLKVVAAAPVTSTFTYQGQLKNGSAAVNGSCQMAFRLYDDPSTGNLISTPITPTVPVTNGLFTVGLNFGSNGNIFDGNGRWLDIRVRCPAGSGSYTTLNPRQPLTAAPYAFALPGLYTQPNAVSPNIIGGFSGNNIVGPLSYGVTIGGGGEAGLTNTVQGITNATFSTIGGGVANTISGTNVYHSVIAGGDGNTIMREQSAIGGGVGNVISNSQATIGGGYYNSAGGWASTIAGGWNNIVTGTSDFIGGGTYNKVFNDYALIGGGGSNTASGWASTVAGGAGNVIAATATYATIGGGQNNAASNTNATVGGGGANIASGLSSVIAGGYNNLASSTDSTVSGGYTNTASAYRATVSGGTANVASGQYATIPGGSNNSATMDYTFAAGNQAHAVNQGSFVWGDSTNAVISSTKDNQFVIRATNGVSLNVNAGSGKAIDVGEYYRDNSIVAWADVNFNGTVLGKFGVSSVVSSTGMYTIVVSAKPGSSGDFIPVAIAEVDSPPTSAGAARLVTINIVAADTFVVFITNGSYALVDNQFVFMVTAR